jgi:hypothetical protein
VLDQFQITTIPLAAAESPTLQKLFSVETAPLDQYDKTSPLVIEVQRRRDSNLMPKVKEFTVTIADEPGALGKCFFALAERGVNILAFQSYVEDGESLARLLVDDPPGAKAVLSRLRMIFEETEVALVRLAHRPGELARAASRLGEKQINIDYSYCGLEPGSTQALLVFGVDNLTKAANLLDELVAEDS